MLAHEMRFRWAMACMVLGGASACTALLGNDFVIVDDASGGSGASGGTGGSGTGTTGGGGTGGAGGMAPQLPPLDCTLDPASVTTLRDLLGNGVPNAEMDEIFGVIADEDPRFFTSYPTPNGNVGEVFTIRDGTVESWSLPANGFLDAQSITPNHAGVLFAQFIGADVQLQYMVLEVNDPNGTGAQISTLFTGPPGAFFGDAKLSLDPQGGLDDVFVTFSMRQNNPSVTETHFLPPASSGANAQVLLANDIQLAESDYDPTAFVHIGATNHIWVGEIGDDPSRYYGFDGVTVPSRPPLLLGTDQHVESVALTDDGRLRVLGIILDTSTGLGSLRVDNLDEAALDGLDLTTMPEAVAITSFADAATQGNFAWSDSHMIWSGRHEGVPRDLKLFVIHESGQTRFEGTFQVPNPVNDFQLIERVHAIANPLFSALAGPIFVSWVERGTDPADQTIAYDRLRYGVVNCDPQQE